MCCILGIVSPVGVIVGLNVGIVVVIIIVNIIVIVVALRRRASSSRFSIRLVWFTFYLFTEFTKTCNPDLYCDSVVRSSKCLQIDRSVACYEIRISKKIKMIYKTKKKKTKIV